MGLFRRFAGHPFAEATGPAGYSLLFRTLDREAVGLDVLRDYRAGANDRTVADRHGSHQSRVGADECSSPDHGAILAEPIVIAGDGPRADVRARTDLSVADVGQMVDLRAFPDRRLLQLNEIPDLGLVREPRPGADPGER